MDRDEILSEDLKYWRAHRPDEWTMDRFIGSAENLQAENERLKKELAAFNEVLKGECFDWHFKDLMNRIKQKAGL